MNKEGAAVSAISTCQDDGTWSASEMSPPGAPGYPSSLPSPESPDIPCSCPSLNLTYNPNDEPGASFGCNKPIDWDNMPVIIDPSTKCYLVCGFMLTATVVCRFVINSR